MIIVWLLAGIAAVSVAFFIPSQSSELWPAINVAAIPVVVYLLALAFYTLRSPITRKGRIIGWIAVVLVGGATSVSWTTMDALSHYQHDKLLQIHSVIVRGILLAYAPKAELKALEAYHNQGSKKKESLSQVFQRLNGGAKTGTNIHKPEYEGDTTLSIVVQSLSDNEVVLVGSHSFGRGRKADFRNVNGGVGLIQERFTLTEKGVTYESEN